MKKEDLKNSFDQIKPSESAKKRMLDNILNHSERKKGIFMTLFGSKKAIPVLALTLVIAGGLLIYNQLLRKHNYGSSLTYNVENDVSMGREDAIAPLLNQFQIDGRHYILLSDELRADYGLPAVVSEKDIGDKITDITTGPDKSLIGKEVYSYIPAGGEAVVAVKKDNEYQLFRFFTFESYNNNQDEDSVKYLALYGIDGADDIAKIQFIGHSEQSKLQGRTDISGEITDKGEIERFYSYYSVLKNSSDKYFDRLFNYRGTDSGNKGIEVDIVEPDELNPPDAIEPNVIAPDQIGHSEYRPRDMASENMASDRIDIAEDLPLEIAAKSGAGVVSGDTPEVNIVPPVNPSHGMMDMGNTESGVSKPGQGSSSAALENLVTIRIYNQRGVYFDSPYYIDFGFISRYEVSEDFAGFMSKYLDK